MSLKSFRIRCVHIFFFALNTISILSAVNVFHKCRDNPIEFGSKFIFNCSNPTEVVYVESAIIGFSSQYNVIECPATTDECTVLTKEPSVYCNGHNECSIAQRILLYNESGLQCSRSDTNGQSGGNFINIRYFCISPDLCAEVHGYIDRYTCSLTTTTRFFDDNKSLNSVKEIRNLSMTTTSVVSEAPKNSSGYRSNPSQQEDDKQTPLVPMINSSSVSAGAIGGIVTGTGILVITLTALTIVLLRRKRRLKESGGEIDRPAVQRQQTFKKETVIVYNSDSNIKSKMTSNHQAAPTPFLTKKESCTNKQRNETTNESQGKVSSRQRSVYELAGDIINYDTIRSSSVPVNANSDVAFGIVGNIGQVLYRTMLKHNALAHEGKIDDENAQEESVKERDAVLNYSSPSPLRNNSEGNYYNCTALEMVEHVSDRKFESAAEKQNRAGERFVDWATDGDVILVDNDIYGEL